MNRSTKFIPRFLKFICTGIACFGLAVAGCDVDVEEEGELPEVEVKSGEMPEVDVDGPEVEMDTETVEVPDVDVTFPDDDN